MHRLFSSLMFAALAILLQACSAGDAPLESDLPPLDAAAVAPCEQDFAFQTELNGAPDDTRSETTTVGERSIITQQYWYAETAMVVSFSYAFGESWCNVWNESGVDWNAN